MSKAKEIVEGYGDNYSVSLSASGSWRIQLKIPDKSTDMIRFRDIIDGVPRDKQDDMLDELEANQKKLEKQADVEVKGLADAVEIMLESVALKYANIGKSKIAEMRNKYGA
jgi:hypothetical protein